MMQDKLRKKINLSYLKNIGSNQLSEYEEAQTMNETMIDLNIGTGKLSELTGIPRRTIRNRLELLEASKEQINAIQNKTKTYTQVIQELKPTFKVKKDCDKTLIEIINKISALAHNKEKTSQTIKLIEQCMKELNTYKFRISKE